MKLSARLQAIYEMVKENTVVADVGCDHAFLPCALILNKKIIKAYACDVNEEPLKQAKKSIQYYNLDSQIQVVLSDGIANVPSDATTLVIAGMGYETIKMILENGFDQLSQFSEIIIQSNRDVDKIRKYINDKHFKIIEERCVFEEHFYQIIKFSPVNDESLNEQELLFGRRMKKDESFYKMWEHNRKKYQNILDKLESKNEKYLYFDKLIKDINNEIGS